jgi:hypothetical protein
MLSAARAERLVRRLARRRADGSRGRRAQRAWRTLTAAGDRGDEQAIEAAWQAWLREPGDELWQALRQWREPRVLAEAVFAAATDPARAPGDRAAIGNFCVQQAMIPDDDLQRVMFYALTGQAGQHRAADPDGRLVTVGYQAAQEPVRAALRVALTEAGDLDMARVIGAGRAELTAEEAAYLTSHLARRRDWGALWRLAQGLPPVRAVDTMMWFGDGWRPDDDRGLVLFGRLAQADPLAIDESRQALGKPAVLDIDLDDGPTTGAFSPDGRYLAVATERGRRYSGCRVLELSGGTVTERHDYNGNDAPAAMLHLGDAFFVVGHHGYYVWELVRYAGGQPTVTDWNRAPMTAKLLPAGFVTAKYGLDHEPLRFRDPGGEITREVMVGIPNARYLAAADPLSGRLAIRGWSGLSILDEDASSVLASTMLPDDSHPRLFLGPDRVLVASSEGYVTVYRRSGDRLEAVQASPTDNWSHIVPLGEQIAVLSGQLVRYLDAETLTEVRQPGRLPAGHMLRALWGSPDGRSHAFGGKRDGQGIIEVIWDGDPAVQALGDRPMSAMRPADLATVRAALAGPGTAPAARPFLELLRDCLEHRFATEVSATTASVAAADDISVSDGG